MSKQKVQQRALTLLGVEVDEDELSTKLFGSYSEKPTFKSREKTEGQTISELENDPEFNVELLNAFNIEKEI